MVIFREHGKWPGGFCYLCDEKVIGTSKHAQTIYFQKNYEIGKYAFLTVEILFFLTYDYQNPRPIKIKMNLETVI